MTVEISEIKNDKLLKLANKCDKDQNGKLDDEELESIFSKINKKENFYDFMGTIGAIPATGVIVVGGLFGCFAVLGKLMDSKHKILNGIGCLSLIPAAIATGLGMIAAITGYGRLMENKSDEFAHYRNALTHLNKDE